MTTIDLRTAHALALAAYWDDCTGTDCSCTARPAVPTADGHPGEGE